MADDLPESATYPVPTVALIAVREVMARHQHELAEVLTAARAVCDLPEGNFTLDMAEGVWMPRPSNG